MLYWLAVADPDRLIELLTDYHSPRAFNQYREVHASHDRPRAAGVRRQNLRQYLEAFATARFLLVGEAAGYAGCRFSGIPFTCEAQLAGPQALSWTRVRNLARSSSAAAPWVERSARIVWQALDGRADCVLWNAFPWHPFGRNGPLSNLAPGSELSAGFDALECVLSLFPSARPYAVGRVAERALQAVGVQTPYIRHPSHGGKRAFLQAVAELSLSPGGDPAPVPPWRE